MQLGGAGLSLPLARECPTVSVLVRARTALITRGLAEMSRLGAALGARPAAAMGMAGLGDLVLTCTRQPVA